MGGIAELLVPDNLKSAVAKLCRYEPQANATYEDLAAHYRTAILPARGRHPRDKEYVEIYFNRARPIKVWVRQYPGHNLGQSTNSAERSSRFRSWAGFIMITNGRHRRPAYQNGGRMDDKTSPAVLCRERLGGLLMY